MQRIKFAGREKLKARAWVGAIFFEKTGLIHLLPGKQFWELCADQTQPTSSFHQFRAFDLFTADQYRGVDINARVIRKNREFHGDTVQFYKGSWDSVIKDEFLALRFNPQLIYLDTQNMPYEAGKRALFTMNHCPQGTVLVVNIVMQNFRKSWKQMAMDEFLKAMAEAPSSLLSKWHKDMPSLPYTGTNNIHMLQVALYKEHQ